MKLVHRKLIANKFSKLKGVALQAYFAAICASLWILQPGAIAAQQERPALIPNAQGSGSEGKDAQKQTNELGELTNDPIQPGEAVHVSVFGAPDFSMSARVSESGEIPYPVLGALQISGLNSADAAKMLASKLKDANLVLDPHVLVTVDSSASAITLLGEVKSPGVYPPPAKHMLSDLLAAAGGLTATTGRVIEITNDRDPGKKELIPWDPTLRKIDEYDRPVHPGDRIVVRACGLAYVGGHVMKPGAYSLCGSSQMTVSEVIAMAGGIAPLTSYKHTYLVRTQPNGTKTVTQFDVGKILRAQIADPTVDEDDILYVSPSQLKDALTRAMGFALTLSGPLIYTAYR
ncbi:MAG TPA: SLBB domain-containing protein [Terracidiphilus sp.]|nr:SLBB domain-containing protein [Terracidiphilus sp.]